MDDRQQCPLGQHIKVNQIRSRSLLARGYPIKQPTKTSALDCSGSCSDSAVCTFWPKGSLISESFSVCVKSPKKVPNRDTSTEDSQGRNLAPFFWRFGPK